MIKFLEQVLHIPVSEDKMAITNGLPNYLLSRYAVYQAKFDSFPVLFVYPLVPLGSLHETKTHLGNLRRQMNQPVVLMLEMICARQRKGLIDAGIPFVVKGKQCYLPFLGILLSERCDVQQEVGDAFLPSTQLLLFYYLLKKEKELSCQEATAALGVSAMTITRAVRELEQTDVIKTFKRGVSKFITTNLSRQELFDTVRKRLISPIRTVGYLLRSEVDTTSLCLAGDEALAHYSMLNPPRVSCYATGDGCRWKDRLSDDLVDADKQVEVQIWKYSPNALSKDGFVDPLSLAMCYEQDKDERVNEAVEQMLETCWR